MEQAHYFRDINYYMLKKDWSVGRGWTSLHVHPPKYASGYTTALVEDSRYNFYSIPVRLKSANDGGQWQHAQ